MAKYRKYFAQAIGSHYMGKSSLLITEIDNNYKTISRDTQFSFTSKNPIDRRLDFSAYFLALVKSLDEQGESYETIRAICLEIVLEFVRPKNKFQLYLKQIPVKLINYRLTRIFLQVLGKKMSQKAHDDGFVAKIITDKNDTFGLGYGFDILECGICKLFKKHHFEKYSSILCEVDEVTSRLAGLTLVRTSTIALGARKCDFRFKKNIPDSLH